MTKIRLPLTERQRAACGCLERAGLAGLTPRDLAAPLGTSPQGAAQTAASLCAKGLVRRQRILGRLVYVAEEIEPGDERLEQRCVCSSTAA